MGREDEVGDIDPYAGGDGARHGSVSVDASQLRKMSVAVPDFVNIAEEGAKGAENERRMGFLESIKLYPKAVGWSVLLSTALVMEGYDVSLQPDDAIMLSWDRLTNGRSS
jgi:hypothetical protein